MRFPRPRAGRSVRVRGVRLEVREDDRIRRSKLHIQVGTKAMQAIVALEQKGRS